MDIAKNSFLITIPTLLMEKGFHKTLTGYDFKYMPGKIIRVNFDKRDSITFGFKKDSHYDLQCLMIGIDLINAYSIGPNSMQEVIGPIPATVLIDFLDERYFEDYFNKTIGEVLLDFTKGEWYTQHIYQIGHEILMLRMSNIGNRYKQMELTDNHFKVTIPLDNYEELDIIYDNLIMEIIADDYLSEIIEFTEINIRKKDVTQIGSYLIVRDVTDTDISKIIKTVNGVITINNSNTIKLDRKLNLHLPMIYQQGRKFADTHLVVKTDHIPETEEQIQMNIWFNSSPTKERLINLIDFVPEYDPKEEDEDIFIISMKPIKDTSNTDKVIEEMKNDVRTFTLNSKRETVFKRKFKRIPKNPEESFFTRVLEDNYPDTIYVTEESYQNVRENISREVWVTDVEVHNDYVNEVRIGPTIPELLREITNAVNTNLHESKGISFKLMLQEKKFQEVGIDLKNIINIKVKILENEAYNDILSKDLVSLIGMYTEEEITKEIFLILNGKYRGGLISDIVTSEILNPMETTSLHQEIYSGIEIDSKIKPYINLEVRKELEKRLINRINLNRELIKEALLQFKDINEITCKIILVEYIKYIYKGEEVYK